MQFKFLELLYEPPLSVSSLRFQPVLCSSPLRPLPLAVRLLVVLVPFPLSAFLTLGSLAPSPHTWPVSPLRFLQAKPHLFGKVWQLIAHHR